MIIVGIGVLFNLMVICVFCCKLLFVNFVGGVVFGLLFFGLVLCLVLVWFEFVDFLFFGWLN